MIALIVRMLGGVPIKEASGTDGALMSAVTLKSLASVVDDMDSLAVTSLGNSACPSNGEMSPMNGHLRRRLRSSTVSGVISPGPSFAKYSGTAPERPSPVASVGGPAMSGSCEHHGESTVPTVIVVSVGVGLQDTVRIHGPVPFIDRMRPLAKPTLGNYAPISLPTAGCTMVPAAGVPMVKLDALVCEVTL